MLNKRFTLFVISVLILFVGCVSERVNELQSVEIRQYNGENLSSFIELRDVSIKGPQNIDIKSYRLELSGLVNNPRKYTYDEVLAHQKYKKVVQINCVEGWKSKNLWEGILLKDVLDEAGLDPKANTIIFYAYDGYSTSLPLEYILDKNILLGTK
ncbi:MAG: TMAO/DMSO reductase [Candidatus Methanofastidiosum methylothiophilum]|uniref:TMAO/DMSO reductase n=1 Tax=Candidatus Methanofastidiosum methylothiophilum TaxID=1705564 RepID=A0A150JAW3_9EURY|nr:MAG: TMAO/DMSO reductase [Candidatus Methanofastidiosum methylthiophilus]